MTTLSLSQQFAKEIRIQSLKMVVRAKASHIGSALSIADIVAVLYQSVLTYDNDKPNLSSRDRFILSKGHACVAVYAALALKKFFPEIELMGYGKNNSRLMNHISHKVPGVEFSTGSLGHGLPFGVGKAYFGQSTGKHWNTFVLLSDGELDEGSNWEALLFAGHHKLKNLKVIVDYNNLQSLASVTDTLELQPLDQKLKAFGWDVRTVNGHDHEELRESLTAETTRPLAVIAQTIKGKGVRFMENQVTWHYRTPSPDELSAALRELQSLSTPRHV